MDVKLYKLPLALITVTGEKVRVTPGVLARLSNAFYEKGVNIYCISMGEYSLTFTVVDSDVKKAAEAVRRTIQKDSAFDSLTIEKNVSMITITGRELAEAAGTLARLVEPLAKKFIPVEVVSASYDSVSIIVDWKDRHAAFKLITDSFEKGALVEYYKPAK